MPQLYEYADRSPITRIDSLVLDVGGGAIAGHYTECVNRCADRYLETYASAPFGE